MVLSATKRTSRRDTLTNRCNGGGCKLAGLAPSVGNPLPSVRSAWSRTVHKTPTRLAKELLPVENTRKISKKDMVYNDSCPKIEVNPETYEVKADGELITCEPANELPLAQRYFMY